jgi:ADP-ribose pyrophosphatase YjhB (NUDIX family)
MRFAAPLLLLLKAHNKGYTKKDGTVVAPFDDKRPAAAPEPPSPPKKPGKWSALGSLKQGALFGSKKPPQQASNPPQQAALFGGFMASDHAKDLGQDGASAPKHKPLPASAVAHPQKGEHGQTVMIHYPSKPTQPSTWTDPGAIATFTPGCALPEELNGIPLAPWADAPTTEEGWDYVEGQNDELEEPGMELPAGKSPASGVVVLEPDGRVWVVAPTNGFGGTRNTFPKGSRDFGLSLQANAIKEAYEEAGLKVEIDSFLGDVVRTTSVGRYYLARRVGGTPAGMGWESQAVRLVPTGQLRKFLDRGDDKKIAEWLEGLV